MFDKRVVNLCHLWLQLYDTAGKAHTFEITLLNRQPNSEEGVFCHSSTGSEKYNHMPLSLNPEVQHFCDGVPFILVGCKADLHKDSVLSKKLLSYGQCAVAYIQVSSS